MSARSRALEDLAAHFRALRDGAAGELDPHAPSVYNGYELWDRAADMTSRTADDSTWRHRARWFFERLHHRITICRHRPAVRRANRVQVAVLEHDLFGVQPAPGTVAAGVIGLRTLVICQEHEPVDVGTYANEFETVWMCVRCGRSVRPTETGWALDDGAPSDQQKESSVRGDE